MEEVVPKIYLKLITYNPFRCDYLYFDTDKHLADDIFINNKIPNIKFKYEYGHPDYPGYRVIICSIYRWNTKQFLDSMELLEKKIAIVDDYNKYIDLVSLITTQLSNYNIKSKWR